MPEPIEIHVETAYLPERSTPGRFLFAYRVTIRNCGLQVVQLLERHWIITDASGRVTEVRGEGVIGQRPILRPGECFDYASSASVIEPPASMRGSYAFRSESGEVFEAPIASFALRLPEQPGALN
ncbi:ApaG protein [Deinobacterium chartae]|uniref:ApaG protein n=1 Tax=Deinobacterium chartae TaxID=521158 RepID=A0A841HTC5_9DEIO|nr:Co2+/Mg2+ efflux protein ApaG [Deinobacterium chartae]MBB6096661.1 ApaG protein [Deinobacterium chartae]